MKAQKTYADFANVEQYIEYCHMGNTRIQLRDVYLSGADLCDADLSSADLGGADLSDADLRYANLSDVNLRYANLSNANLSNTNLRNVDLRDAYLRGANLYGANLYGADLRGANLSNVEYNSATAFYALACPEDGAFVAWKKVDRYIVKLEIPSDAKRSSATTRKCRCSHAIVLDIQNLDGTSAGIDNIAHYAYAHVTDYKILSTVIPDSFDNDRWNGCSNGIHFFITRQEAVQY